jgi:3-oxoacyl-[acyl-carrier-protein] synthase II
MDRRRVVITGMGLVCPMGLSVAEAWRNVVAGRSGVGPVTIFDASTFPSRIAAEVRGYEFERLHPDCAHMRGLGRNTRFAIGAAREALADACIHPDNTDPDRFGVYLGSGEGEMSFPDFTESLLAAWREGAVDVPAFCRSIVPRMEPRRELEQEAYLTTAHLARLAGARGPNLTCLTACAASSQAIGEATWLLRRGAADVVLAGGAHSMIHPFGMTGFCLLTALSRRNDEPQRASRPFDRLRDGFVLGEGAGMLILEELEHARRRGATIYAELIGYGASADAFRITDQHETGRGAIQCISLALADAGLRPSADDIHYINAHGTSTQVNDRVETLAIKQVFGAQAYRIPVSSTKSMAGHLIAAAGAFELITCIQAIRAGVLPPTINWEEPDPACDLDYVPNQARPARITTALSNSFGFGGQNVSLIVRRYE